MGTPRRACLVRLQTKIAATVECMICELEILLHRAISLTALVPMFGSHAAVNNVSSNSRQHREECKSTSLIGDKPEVWLA